MREFSAEDTVYINLFPGVHGNYLKPAVVRSGLDPENLPVPIPPQGISEGSNAKRWRNIWGPGSAPERARFAYTGPIAARAFFTVRQT